MAKRDIIKKRKVQIAFEALSIEGGLLPPEWLAKVAHLQSQNQGEVDYNIPKGLNLRDEIGRYYRIAQGLWSDYKSDQDAPGFILGFLKGCLGFDDIITVEPITLKDRVYPVTQCASTGKVPIVIATKEEALDIPSIRFGDGLRKRTAFGLCQEYLNTSEEVLWGIVSNGDVLRILRDNSSLTKPAWIEVDVKRIFEEELFADFAAFWLICHRSRFGAPTQLSHECIIEKWREASRTEGIRANDQLRVGVEAAIEILGQGFLSFEGNMELRESLQKGTLSVLAYFQELLRLVYRLIFLLTVEERRLLHPKETSEETKSLYREGYSVSKLRDRSIRRNAYDRFGDLWQALKIVCLGTSKGESRLGIPALGGLFLATQTPHLDRCALENRTLLEAIYRLCWLKEDGCIVRINWRDMGSEELGSVYESLLELVPQVKEEGRRFTFAHGSEAHGNTRKLTGSYYTPDSLVQSLLDTALEPVILTIIRSNKEQPAEALLKLTIVDPACGSGHFLLAAARRLAAHVARLKVNGTPTAEDYRKALRRVISCCIYGVDLNPMAVELCKVSLWLEAIEPSKPLSFLNHHIRVGNSLFGTTPKLIAAGLPDDAFIAIEGDDKRVCASLKKRNKAECSEWGPLFAQQDKARQVQLEQAAASFAELPDDCFEDIQAKENVFRIQETNDVFLLQKKLADAWCAAFVIRKEVLGQGWERKESGITQEYFNALANGQSLPIEYTRVIESLTHQYQFFHWHLAFPEVFANGGFDCVLGNPPWERVKLQEKEWFAEKIPQIASAPNAAARKKLIEKLKEDVPDMYQQYLDDSRKAEGESHFLRNSDRYPLCGRGDINLYSVFAESMRTLLKDIGRVGCVLPSGIATDDTTKLFFQDIVERKSLISLFDFENKGLFPDVHSSMKFCLFTCGRGIKPVAEQAEFIFFSHSVDDLRDPNRRFTLSAEDILLLNPNTRTCPIFRSQLDAELTKAIYRRVPVLIREAQGDQPEVNPWCIKFSSMFHMSNDSYLFRTREQLEVDGWQFQDNNFYKDNDIYMPLYEAKMADLYNHRTARVVISKTALMRQGQPEQLSKNELANPSCLPTPRVWINQGDVNAKLSLLWKHKFLLGWRRISAVTNERTLQASILPLSGVGDSIFLLFPNIESTTVIACLTANLSQFVFDFITRQKMGGVNVSYFIFNQLSILPPTVYAQKCYWGDNSVLLQDWITKRVLELVYTAWDLKPFALDCGYDGPPFRWDEERRFLLRCELDAAFFHLYLGPQIEWQQKSDTLTRFFPSPRHAVDYIMETFPIVKRKDEAKFNDDYRTKRVILEIYDALTESIITGKPYQTRLDPPPADTRVAHEGRSNRYEGMPLQDGTAARLSEGLPS